MASSKLGFGAAVLALLALFSGFLSTGWQADAVWWSDWEFYMAIREAVRRAWESGGGFNAWVPYFCGGFPILDSTEAPYFSPFVLLWQLIGVVPGAKWEFVIVLTVGMLGMYRLIGHLAPNSPQWMRAAGCLQFAATGFFFVHLIGGGHVSFAFFSWYSWIVLGFLTERPMMIAMTVGLLPYVGTNNCFMHSILFTALLALSNPRQWFLIAMRAGATVVALAAPIFAYHGFAFGQSAGLKLSGSEHHEIARSVLELFRFLGWPVFDLYTCDTDCNFEYANFVGPVALLVGSIGLFVGAYFHSWMRPILAVALLYFAFAAGPFSRWAPFSLLSHFPLLNRLQVNTRFLLEFSVLMYLGYFWILGWLYQGSRLRKIAAALILILGLAPVLWYSSKILAMGGQGAPMADLRGQPTGLRQIVQMPDHRVGRYEAMANQSGISNCHVSSAKGTYGGKLRVGESALLYAAPQTEAWFDGAGWRVDWRPTPDAQAIPKAWWFNQNWFPEISVESLTPGVPSESLRIFARDGLFGFETSLVPKSGELISFRAKLKAPRYLIFSFGVALIAWGLALTSFLPRRRDSALASHRKGASHKAGR